MCDIHPGPAATRPLFFRLPLPGGARRMLDRIRTFTHTSEILNGTPTQAGGLIALLIPETPQKRMISYANHLG